MTSVTTQVFAAADIHRQIVGILTAWGMPEDAAVLTAAVMVDTDLSGVDSHGISMLMFYEKLHLEGRLDLAARPEVVRELPAFAVIDGHNGLGHPVAVAGMQLAMEKARTAGVGVVVARNSNHFGAVGYYSRLASSAGMLGFVTTTTRTPLMSATGGTTPVLGTNPLSFTAPRAGGEPLVVDISTSVVAMNKVKAYGLKGLDLPEGWLTDLDGNTVTDANLGYEMLVRKQGTLSPLGGPTTQSGGHKGFGLSLMVQVFSAALSNAAAPGLGGDHDNIGHFFLSIDPELVNPGGLTPRHVDDLMRSLQDGEPAVLIPGQPEERSRLERGLHGIPVPAPLMDHIVAICGRAGVPVTMTPLLRGQLQ
jgi:LDH2 family malate/lactate/ureidoglycolate dehydrogenase